MIYLTVKSTCKINKHGYAATNSETLAAKNWSLASDWEALITGEVSAKQMLMGMIIHRITGSKLVIKYLSRLNHVSGYKKILQQNQALERGVMSDSPSGVKIRTDVPLHSGIDNNDGRQETITGSGTTHHTNSLFFQEESKPNSENTGNIVTLNAIPPGTREIRPYFLGPPKDPPLIRDFIDVVDTSLLDIRLKEDILWSVMGGLPDAGSNNHEESLVGSWTSFQRLSSNVKLNCISFGPGT